MISERFLIVFIKIYRSRKRRSKKSLKGMIRKSKRKPLCSIKMPIFHLPLLSPN